MSDKSDDRKISEALDLLEDVAKSKKDDLKKMVANGYSNLEELFGNIAGNLGADVKAAGKEYKETVIGLVESIDKNVRKNPWPYIGGVALAVLILGAFQGRSKK